ncbi:G-protein coupled receptor family C group 6 member A-like [Aquarana catesbeiana]|uniref:G-protein coupled receptor family C group 6 member A-like n=1 Tax=Aquarana catesbeiana TaxID=8400 RepID=UPI003CC97FB9
MFLPPIITLSSLFGFALSCRSHKYVVAQKPGDIMLGGIFPIHDGVNNLLERLYVDEFTCTGLQLRTMVSALSMIYSIEKINNSTLLQGIKLGYEIFDSCSDPLKAVQATLKLLPEIFAINNSTQCNSTEVIPAIKAVIGEVNSEISIAIGRILSSYFIPQISIASSANSLIDKMRYPSFLRTIPGDYYQTKAIMDLIKVFEWNWIGIIVSDDEYGLTNLDLLSSLFIKNGVCPALVKTVPSYVKHPYLQESLNNVISDLKNSTAKVVITFTREEIMAELFSVAIHQNLSRTWIASDGWVNSKLVASIEDIAKVGTIFGFTFTSGLVPGIDDYLKNPFLSNDAATNEILDEYKMLRFECSEDYRKYLKCLNSTSGNCPVSASAMHKSPLACIVDDVSQQNDDYLVQYKEQSYSTALAVTAIAQALKNIVCKDGTCDKDLQVSPRKLLTELKKNNFTYNGKSFHIDTNGDVLRSYNLFNWQIKNKSVNMMIVGQYNTINENLSINQSLLVWNNVNGSVPFSNCTATCKPGYFKKHSFTSCCYECIACAENNYSPMPDMAECFVCPSHQWSSNGSSWCNNKTVQYLEWKDPFAVTLVTFGSFGIAVLLLIVILFVKNANNSSVKAAGGHYAYLLIVSLIFSLASICFFIGEPNPLVCQIRQPLYGISFTIAVNCILIKSILILIAFESAKKGKRIGNFTLQRSIIVVAVLSGGQVVICLVWLILKSPSPMTDNNTPQLIIKYCDEGSYVAFGIMLGYIGMLALTCFLLAYKGRKLPDKYNEARSITFSMLVYMFVWILFIPVYKNFRGMYLSAVQIVAILSSVFGFIGCHLLPVCYIVLFKQTENVSENSSTIEFFRAKARKFFMCTDDVSEPNPPANEIQRTT